MSAPRRRLFQSAVDQTLVHSIRIWANDFIRIELGGKRGADGQWHTDGWPSISPAGRLSKQGEGFSQVQHAQHFAEVYRPDGWLIRRAMDRMPEALRLAMFTRYVYRAPPDVAAEYLQISRARFFQLLDGAHIYLRARLDGFEAESTARLEQLTA